MRENSNFLRDELNASGNNTMWTGRRFGQEAGHPLSWFEEMVKGGLDKMIADGELKETDLLLWGWGEGHVHALAVEGWSAEGEAVKRMKDIFLFGGAA